MLEDVHESRPWVVWLANSEPRQGPSGGCLVLKLKQGHCCHWVLGAYRGAGIKRFIARN